MFLLIGVSPIKRAKENKLRRHCPHCNDIRTFQEIQYRQFLTLFFIPILPISKSNSVFSCVSCGYSMNTDFAVQTAAQTSSPPTFNSDQVVIVCPRCEGPMFIPIKEFRQTVTCPHCTMEFIMKGIKGEIPIAAITE